MPIFLILENSTANIIEKMSTSIIQLTKNACEHLTEMLDSNVLRPRTSTGSLIHMSGGSRPSSCGRGRGRQQTAPNNAGGTWLGAGQKRARREKRGGEQECRSERIGWGGGGGVEMRRDAGGGRGRRAGGRGVATFEPLTNKIQETEPNRLLSSFLF